MLQCKVGAIWSYRGPVCVAVGKNTNMYWEYKANPNPTWNDNGMLGATCNHDG